MTQRNDRARMCDVFPSDIFPSPKRKRGIKSDIPRLRFGLGLAPARADTIAHGYLMTVLLAIIALAFCPSVVLAVPPGSSSPVANAPPDKDEKPKADKDDEKKAESAKEDEEEEEKEEKEPDRFLAITGGIIHTVAGPVLHDAAILCKNGKIHAIGADLVIPEEAQTLDVTDLHIYPGLVAVGSNRVVGSEPPEDTTDLYALNMTLALAGGITTVLSGNTAAKVTLGSLEDHVIRSNVFTTVNYATRNPDGRRKLRASLDKLRQHMRETEEYERKKKTDPDAKAPDDKWIKGPAEKHLKLLKGETVGVTTANTAHEIVEICDLANTYGIRMVIRGAAEGWTVAPQLARAGLAAIVTLRPSGWGIRFPRDERLNRPNGPSIENAAILHRSGVRLAIIPANAGITTWGVAGRDLLHLAMEAAFGVRGGLPQDAALRAITIDAARLLGVDHRVGSIEVGKDADFAICDGDLLHYMTLVRYAVVNGKIVYDKQKETLYDHIRPEGDMDAPPPDDHWPRRLGEDW